MKVRIKFQKFGAMKFIGHLDVMRYFQKAFRRAQVDNEYTKGFSPHQIMSFAAPLGVGLTSDSEYVDVQLLSSDEPEVMISRINEAMTDGFKITGFRVLKEQEEHQKIITAMALVASADYMVSFKDGYSLTEEIQSQEDFKKSFEQFISANEIIIDKKTKKSEKPVDIRPMITMVAFDQTEYEMKVLETVKDGLEPIAKSESTAEVYENGLKVYLQVDTGSSVNLKPELVMEAYYDYLKVPFEKFAWQVHRMEVYTKDEEGKLIPLEQVER